MIDFINNYELIDDNIALKHELLKIKECQTKLSDIENDIIQHINKYDILNTIRNNIHVNLFNDFQVFLESHNVEVYIKKNVIDEINLKINKNIYRILFITLPNNIFKLVINGMYMCYTHTKYQKIISINGDTLCFHKFIQILTDIEKDIQTIYNFQYLKITHILKILCDKYLENILNIKFDCICGAWYSNPNKLF